MLTTLGISNYRSLRDLVIPLKHLNVITGPNGSGKSNLYRALRLLADTAQGRIITSVAREGGLQSTLWAGPESLSREMRNGEQPVQGTRRKHPVCLRLGFASDEFGYLIDMGLPQPGSSAFGLDPEIKRELIWHGSIPRPSTTLVDRNHCVVRVKDSEKGWNVVTHNLATFDSMMTHIADPRSAAETLALRESIRAWRFYDHFRTDHASPARVPQVGTRTPVLADDGADLAAAMQTIREIGDSAALDRAVADAFPAARVRVEVDSGRFTLAMEQHGMLRPLQASELSDGTLRYLLWVAALLTPRPPSLIVLNEPETSLHPDLLEALGRLIGQASRRSQVIVVTHSAALLSSLAHESEYHPITLEKKLGETSIAGMRDLDRPEWRWPAR
ncbi:MAG TPA: AAA family ATPase [Terriglobales bacterium]|nr:AAA family ATPase [Terriglobales bacterium]